MCRSTHDSQLQTLVIVAKISLTQSNKCWRKCQPHAGNHTYNMLVWDIKGTQKYQRAVKEERNNSFKKNCVSLLSGSNLTHQRITATARSRINNIVSENSTRYIYQTVEASWGDPDILNSSELTLRSKTTHTDVWTYELLNPQGLI